MRSLFLKTFFKASLALGLLSVTSFLNAAASASSSSSVEAFRVYGVSTSEAEIKSALYKVEMEKYNLITQMAKEKYLEQFWIKRAAKEKTSPEKAMKAYVAKNITVSEAQVKETMERVKDHPSFKTLSESEKKQQVMDFLKSRATSEEWSKLLAEGEAKGDLVISFPAPAQPRFDVALTSDDHLRYGPKLTDTTPVNCKGNDCEIRVIEYSEFQCPFCSRVLDSTKKVLAEAKLKGKIVWTVRDFPLSFHNRAKPAGIAAKCASFQGKYWEMYHKLFENQKKLQDSDFNSYASEIGLDTEKFKSCYASPAKAVAMIDKNFSTGQRHGVTGTPAFFINGLRFSGALGYADFMKTINAELTRIEAEKAKKSIVKADPKEKKKG